MCIRDRGGGIIELAAHLYATDHVPYILKRIAEQAPVSYTHLNFGTRFSHPQHLFLMPN